MRQLDIKAVALALGIVFGTAASAQGISQDEYKAGKDRIEADYKTDRAACASMSGNQNDICIAEAKAKEKIGRAELEASYKPTAKNRYQARVAKAEADYAIAKERCDDQAGQSKDVCLKQAKAAQTSAKAEAKEQKETAKAHKEATSDKLDAQYQVAKEKCDSLAGDAKTRCLDQAKAGAGK